MAYYIRGRSRMSTDFRHTLRLKFKFLYDIVQPMSDINAKKQREAIRSFMKKHGLKVYPWCVRAGVSEATLRAFLKGDTNTMQISTLHKLATSMGSTIDEVLDNEFSEKKSGGFIHAGGKGDKGGDGKKTIDPDLVYDATQIANDLHKQGLIAKSKIKEVALEAAEVAANLGSDKVTKNLLLYIIEISGGKK